MSGATFSRVKNWAPEILTNTDLNAEINNILNNLDPSGVGDYSDSASMMRIQTSPGSVGSESLATSLAGELERLRYVIKQLIGTSVTYWYQTAPTSLTDLLSAVGGQVTPNRLVSGAVSTNSGAPRYLAPSGSTSSITLKATATNLGYFINGIQYTATADYTFTGMTVAPTTNNTALINDSALSGQEISKWAGEDGTVLNMTAAGTGISNLAGSFGAFKVVSGGSSEYFIGYVKSSTQITNCLRGCFINSSLAAIPRIPVSNGNTISVMGLGWAFITTAGQVAVSYVNPQVSYETPTSTLGYWFNLGSTAWMTYTGASWTTISQTFIGFSVQDTAACVGVRAINFFGNYQEYNNIVVDYVSSTQIQARNYGSKVAIGASLIDYKITKPIWDITVNRESGYGESASTTYFAYIGESGQIKLSPEKPYYSQDLGRGWYHPYENWRAVASIKNDSGSNFDQHSMLNYLRDQNSQQTFVSCDDIRNIGMAVTVNASAMQVTIQGLDGQQLSPGNPGYISFPSSSATIGTTVTRQLFANMNMTVPSGATLGTFANMSQYEWVYLTENNGTVDTAIVAQQPIFEENRPFTTQLSGSAATPGTLYSQGASAASVSVRYVGRITTNNATASSWISAPTNVALRAPFRRNTEGWQEVVRTTTLGNVSPSVTVFRSRRDGEMLEFTGYVQAVNSTAAAMTVNMPSGITIDSTKLITPGPIARVGEYYYLDNGGGIAYNQTISASGVVFFDSSASVTALGFSYVGASKQYAYANASSVYLGLSAAVTFTFKVPVVGWSVYGP